MFRFHFGGLDGVVGTHSSLTPWSAGRTPESQTHQDVGKFAVACQYLEVYSVES